MTINDSIRAKVLLERYGPDQRTVTRLRSDYELFKKLNPHLSTHKQVLEGLFGQMSESLAPGSCREYITIMDAFVPFPQRAFHVVKASEAHETDRGGRGHAADLSAHDIDTLGRLACDGGTEIDEAMWLQYATGLRDVDTRRLWADALTFEPANRPSRVKIQARWTKGIQKVQNRREISFPLKGLIPPPKQLVARAVAGRKSKQLKRLFNHSYHQMKDRLSDFATEAGIATVSTGSFRRGFSRRIDGYCKTNGIAKVEMMLHVSSSMDKAHYAFDTRL